MDFEESKSNNSIIFEESKSISKSNEIVPYNFNKKLSLINKNKNNNKTNKKHKKYINPNQVKYKDIFRKLKDGESEAIVVYNDEKITCFKDIDENAPKHYVIVSNEKPSNSIENLTNITYGAYILAKKYNYTGKNYRLLMNTYKNSNYKDKIYYLLMDIS